MNSFFLTAIGVVLREWHHRLRREKLLGSVEKLFRLAFLHALLSSAAATRKPLADGVRTGTTDQSGEIFRIFVV